MVDFFLFHLLAKMLCSLWVLVGSAIHKIHNTLKGCNTSWISENRDSKLGTLCVCSTVCMHADGADRSAMAFAIYFSRGFNFRANFIFREIREN